MHGRKVKQNHIFTLQVGFHHLRTLEEVVPALYSPSLILQTRACVNLEWLQWNNSFTNIKQLEEVEHVTFRKQNKTTTKPNKNPTNQKMPDNQKGFNGKENSTHVPSSYT